MKHIAHAIRLTASYASTQGLVQILTLATGILVVRSLSNSEYAYYGILISLLATLILVSDSGVSSLLLSRGAQLVLEPDRLHGLFRAARGFRLYFGAVVIALGSVYLAAILNSAGAPVFTIVLSVIFLVVTAIPIVLSSIAQTYLRLLLRLRAIQRATLIVAGARFALILTIWWTGIGTTELLLAVNLVCTAATAVTYMFLMHRDAPAVVTAPVKVPFFATAMRVLPTTALLASGDQLFYFLLSQRTSAASIGEVIAMTRFGVAFFVISSIVSDIAVPRLARMSGDRRAIAKRIGATLGAYAVFSGAVILAVYLAAPLLLLLLGPGYQSNRAALVVLAAGTSIFYLGLSWDVLNQARGWLRASWVYVPMLAAWAVWAWFYLNDATPLNAGIAYIGLAAPLIATQFIRTLLGLVSRPRPPLALDG